MTVVVRQIGPNAEFTDLRFSFKKSAGARAAPAVITFVWQRAAIIADAAS